MRGPHLETESLVVGYAMSRLDRDYLAARNVPSWRAAFAEAGTALGLPPATFKNLRDEFDPLLGNGRRGWHGRDPRPNRLRVYVELEPVSDAALLELVARILLGDHEADPAIEVLAAPSERVANVAARLLTGRLAEEHFLIHYREILGRPEAVLEDLRLAARGYDFGLAGDPELAVEVKGLRGPRGGLLFTDREWNEATIRRENYLLVVVGDLETTPRHEIVRDPARELEARCDVRATVVASWSAPYALTPR